MDLYMQILNKLNSKLEPLEFESHPFKISWYNSHVDEKFKLNYPDDTFAVLFLNKPGMFESLFLPYLFENYQKNLDKLESLNDPVDLCMNETFDSTKRILEETVLKDTNIEVEKIHDYEMTPGFRRPKIVMQTCAHIAGAAYYYDPKKMDKNQIVDKNNQEFLNKNLMGVCVHPKFGGWFALRCVFIFKNLELNEEILAKKEPIDSLNGNVDLIVDLLKKFNFNWRDSTYRDIIKVNQSYSDIQQEYFLLEPKFRKELLKKWLIYTNHKCLCDRYNKELKDKKLKEYFLKNFYLY